MRREARMSWEEGGEKKCPPGVPTSGGTRWHV